MDGRTDESTVLTLRDTPKIAGSSGAFIALVVILVLIIIVSCIAVFYLLREDLAHDEEALKRRARGRYQQSGSREDPSYTKTAKKWYTRVLNLSSLRNRDENPRPAKPRRHGRGWIQAGSGSEWESDSSDEIVTPRKKNNTVLPTTMRMKDRDSSFGTPRSSTPGSAFPPRSPNYTPPSDTSSSSLQLDPHRVRGLSYPDQYAPSPQGAPLPSIDSQLYSPSSSYSPSPSPAHQNYPNRMNSTSSIPVENVPSNDSINGGGRSFATQSGPAMRTFEGGTKFIEAL